MEDRGGYAVVGGELGYLSGGALGDDGAGDEAGGVGAVELIEGVDGGLDFGSRHGIWGEMCEFGAGFNWVSCCSPRVSAGFSFAGCGLGLEDGEEGGEEGDLGSGDGGKAQEAVFDLGDELGVGGVIGGGGVEGDVCDIAEGETGNRSAGGFGIGGEVGGADEVGGDDVGAGGGVAVAEEVEEVGVGHGS